MTNIIRNSGLALALLAVWHSRQRLRWLTTGTAMSTATAIRGVTPITIGTGTTAPTATATTDMPIVLLITATGIIPATVVQVSASISANRYW